ncbi:GNAT family N-acetyltransferase, partial [bacterium]|nr:GNAT family N-acetyltransferase [bacterium]
MIMENFVKATFDDAAELAGLAETIWREHYTPIIGAEQVEYMLER